AVELAQTGRPGPVSVEIPIDQQYRAIDAPDAIEPFARPERVKPDAASLSAAIALLARARRPLIWAGGGVIAADASAQLKALAERLGAGVITSASGRGSLPEDHPQ